MWAPLEIFEKGCHALLNSCTQRTWRERFALRIALPTFPSSTLSLLPFAQLGPERREVISPWTPGISHIAALPTLEARVRPGSRFQFLGLPRGELQYMRHPLAGNRNFSQKWRPACGPCFCAGVSERGGLLGWFKLKPKRIPPFLRVDRPFADLLERSNASNRKLRLPRLTLAKPANPTKSSRCDLLIC